MKGFIGRRWWLLIFAVSGLLPACQQKMASQPYFRREEPSAFFPDGRTERPLVPGTIARGQLRTDLALYSGKRSRLLQDWSLPAALLAQLASPNLWGAVSLAAIESNLANDNNVDRFPFPVTREVIENGRNRYMIFCVMCHDALGTGRGKIVERGFTPPPSYHIDRLRRVSVGYIFEVITNGYGSMPDYRQQIPPRDRWAITSYIRALQLSQHFPEGDLPENLRRDWANQKAEEQLP